jgi:hypothetical protein
MAEKLTYGATCSTSRRDDAFLRALHPRCLHRGGVVIAVQVEQTVHEIKLQLVRQ